MMEKIRINVGGIVHLTTQETLNKFPETRLGRLKPNNSNYDEDAKEYYFDRNAPFFYYVLEFYRTGHLHIPRDMCSVMVRAEMAFWGLEQNDVADCCIDHCEQYEMEQEHVKVLQIWFFVLVFWDIF